MRAFRAKEATIAAASNSSHTAVVAPAVPTTLQSVITHALGLPQVGTQILAATPAPSPTSASPTAPAPTVPSASAILAILQHGAHSIAELERVLERTKQSAPPRSAWLVVDRLLKQGLLRISPDGRYHL